MAALVSALLVVLAAVAAGPISGAWMGRDAGDARVYGTVNDSTTLKPLFGVSVVVFNVGYTNSTPTDASGNYSMYVPPGDYTLSFSLSGYDGSSQPVSLATDQILQLYRSTCSRCSVADGIRRRDDGCIRIARDRRPVTTATTTTASSSART